MPALDPAFQALVEAQAKAAAEQPLPPLDQLPPDMVRAGYVHAAAEPGPERAQGRGGARLRDPRAARRHPGAALHAGRAWRRRRGLLVYYHGGGWVIGDLDTHDGHCRRMAAWAGCRVMAVHYRLAPENPFPKGHDDALAAATWAFDHAGEIGVDARRIAVGGD